MRAGPREAGTTHADAVANGLAVGLDEIEKVVWRINYDRSRFLFAVIGDFLAQKFRIDLAAPGWVEHRIVRRDAARTFAVWRGGGLWRRRRTHRVCSTAEQKFDKSAAKIDVRRRPSHHDRRGRVGIGPIDRGLREGGIGAVQDRQRDKNQTRHGELFDNRRAEPISMSKAPTIGEPCRLRARQPWT